jgi:cytochrome P450
MLAHTRDLIEHKRRKLADDLLTAPIEAGAGNDHLTEDELTSMVFVASHDTTVSLIANALALLTTRTS